MTRDFSPLIERVLTGVIAFKLLFLGGQNRQKVRFENLNVLQKGFLMMQDWVSRLVMASYACLVRLKSENGWIVFFLARLSEWR